MKKREKELVNRIVDTLKNWDVYQRLFDEIERDIKKCLKERRRKELNNRLITTK